MNKAHSHGTSIGSSTEITDEARAKNPIAAKLYDGSGNAMTMLNDASPYIFYGTGILLLVGGAISTVAGYALMAKQ